MSNQMQWDSSANFDHGIERLKTFTEPLAPVVARPTETHLQEFAAVIENVIVPRLLMSHVHGGAVNEKLRKKRAKATLGSVAVLDFVDQTMLDDPDAAINHVRHLLDNGVAFQDILLELMAPAARILGERWEADTTSFVEVALGIARMHRILREFDGIPSHLWSNNGAGRHALLLPTPGEQHTFGLRLVQEFLLREGWSVTNRTCENIGDLAKLVSNNHFDVVGLSLSGETLLEPFMSAIRLIRTETVNPHVKVIVGGHIFVERPALIESCGSDAYAVDAPATVRIVNGWARQLAGST
jgi:MerR family transcriptional regulator, light-induced transcriptional regulator